MKKLNYLEALRRGRMLSAIGLMVVAVPVLYSLAERDAGTGSGARAKRQLQQVQALLRRGAAAYLSTRWFQSSRINRGVRFRVGGRRTTELM